ncbi:uncharacterized protein BCR38DRAFT_137334 [Pseudomassariella vexata]|uniref:Uncharacterized protein n=1 Tax=Pseudomassariella vexata TaxID=1141098 RepID=A0A1Y2EAY3_9PEZI|nr:uncharacterized protein BCR38DRAFT_137334 [Pseudomassariella vexata]ORY68721.1 hypothetical protein BCR38DRAFT_137334 [Pseudomassariella vexata]
MMAEPENFEEDLFADLYDDNDTAATPAASKPEPSSEPHAPAAPVPEYNPDESAHAAAEQNGYGEEYHEDTYEDDDDVNFNLGNTASNNDANSHSQQDVSTPTYHSHSGRGSSAKEDG